MVKPEPLKKLQQNDLQGLITTVVDNYGTCRLTEFQLQYLQDWIKEQQKINR
jgi:DNA replication protein DnaD